MGRPRPACLRNDGKPPERAASRFDRAEWRGCWTARTPTPWLATTRSRGRRRETTAPFVGGMQGTKALWSRVVLSRAYRSGSGRSARGRWAWSLPQELGAWHGSETASQVAGRRGCDDNMRGVFHQEERRRGRIRRFLHPSSTEAGTRTTGLRGPWRGRRCSLPVLSDRPSVPFPGDDGRRRCKTGPKKVHRPSPATAWGVDPLSFARHGLGRCGSTDLPQDLSPEERTGKGKRRLLGEPCFTMLSPGLVNHAVSPTASPVQTRSTVAPLFQARKKHLRAQLLKLSLRSPTKRYEDDRQGCRFETNTSVQGSATSGSMNLAGGQGRSRVQIPASC
ncbi:hypothetical protein VTK73DRAFT_3772 [Phialemonium thermophilum]|uniref:Uncharacterized protein n=1 Tax=Phialemonium thermophilum TaxID=223376 RepID=A0ABR3VFE8_9PEZI